MTASGSCYECGKTATSFHYTTPRSETPGRHEGYWHCPEHGPSESLGLNLSFAILDDPPHQMTIPLNRKERRKQERRNR